MWLQLEKIYDPTNEEDDMVEMEEERLRMREHVMNEVESWIWKFISKQHRNGEYISEWKQFWQICKMLTLISGNVDCGHFYTQPSLKQTENTVKTVAQLCFS